MPDNTQQCEYFVGSLSHRNNTVYQQQKFNWHTQYAETGSIMEFNYQTKGTCSSNIKLDINDGVVTNVVFTGGCNGNLKAIPALIDGWTYDQIAAKCHGIQCGLKGTSCADQLAYAVEAAHAKEMEDSM